MAAVGEQKERRGDEWFESRNLLQETPRVQIGWVSLKPKSIVLLTHCSTRYKSDVSLARWISRASLKAISPLISRCNSYVCVRQSWGVRMLLCYDRSWEGWSRPRDMQMIIPEVSRVTGGKFGNQTTKAVSELHQRRRATVGWVINDILTVPMKFECFGMFCGMSAVSQTRTWEWFSQLYSSSLLTTHCWILVNDVIYC